SRRRCLPGSTVRLRERAGAGVRVHRTPFRPLWTELKGFGSTRRVASLSDGVHSCAVAPRRFQPKDVLRETFLTHLAVAPDGSSVVYGRRTVEDGQYRTRLWRVATSGGRPEQITTGDGDVRPRFSPDGQTLAVIPNRSEKAQPWLLPLSGRAPPQVDDVQTTAAAPGD